MTGRRYMSKEQFKRYLETIDREAMEYDPLERHAYLIGGIVWIIILTVAFFL